jgi:hypothetical protein
MNARRSGRFATAGLRPGLAGALAAVAGCSTPPGPVVDVAEIGPMEAGAPDAMPDAAPDAAGPSVCERWCDATITACGAGPNDCAADCLALLGKLRPACADTFVEHFSCLLDAGAWACVSPGVVRVDACETSEASWRACDP